MTDLYANTPSPATMIVFLAGIIISVYCLLRYRKNLDIWTTLFFVFLLIDSMLFLFGEALEANNTFLFVKPTIDILSCIFFVFWFVILTKLGFKNTWESKTGRKLIIISGIFILISIALIAISFFLKKFG